MSSDKERLFDPSYIIIRRATPLTIQLINCISGNIRQLSFTGQGVDNDIGESNTLFGVKLRSIKLSIYWKDATYSWKFCFFGVSGLRLTCDKKDLLQVDISWQIVLLIIQKSTHFPGIFANALYARAIGSIWAPEFKAFTLHPCLLVILSVYIMKLNPNCTYLDEDSSIIFRDNRRKRIIEFIVLATRSCFLILLLVRMLRPGPNHSYSGRDSSVFAMEARGKSESRLSDIDMINLMGEDW